MRIEANLQYHPASFLPQLTTCQIEKVVELPDGEFSALLQYPMREHRFIAENLSCIVDKGSVIHSLMALGQGRNDGVIVAAEGRVRAEYAAYLPEARSTINKELDRAADFIIQHGTERTGTESWCVCFEELQEHLGLNIQEGNGLDAMLKSVLERRPEIASVEMHSGCITAEYLPEFCRQFQNHSEAAASDIRLKDVLPLLKNGGMSFLCHAETESSIPAENLRLLTASGQQDYDALLNARVSEICPSAEGVEVVLTGVEPEELTRLGKDYENFIQAGQAMELTM